jgi:hypothetical protein
MILFFISILLTSVLSFVLTLFLPWWTIAIASFVVYALFSSKIKSPFIGGFIGIALFWLILIIIIGFKDNFVFADKVAMIFGEGLHLNLNAFVISSITLLIGGLIGGLSACSAAMIFSPKIQNKISIGKRRVKGEGYTLKL